MEAVGIPQPTPPVEQKSTDWMKIILAAVLGFILLAGSAYAGYWYGTQQVLPVEEPTPAASQPTTIPTPTVKDETEDWETYTGVGKIGMNFSIKYPEGWFLSEEGGGTGSPWVILSQNFVEGVASRESPCFSIGGGIWPDITLEEFTKTQDSGGLVLSSGEEISIAPEVRSTREISLNSYSGIKRLVVEYGEQKESFQVFLKGGLDYVYGGGSVNFLIFRSCPDTKEETFDQILSTFEFID